MKWQPNRVRYAFYQQVMLFGNVITQLGDSITRYAMQKLSGLIGKLEDK